VASQTATLLKLHLQQMQDYLVVEAVLKSVYQDDEHEYKVK